MIQYIFCGTIKNNSDIRVIFSDMKLVISSPRDRSKQLPLLSKPVLLLLRHYVLQVVVLWEYK